MTKTDETALRFKALSDPTRFRILKLLAPGKTLCVSAISQRLDAAQPVISQHLKILRHAGLVTATRMGLYIHYRINTKTIGTLAKAMQEFL
jgi:ArsR family transcriptional regulator, arsenate/arsenite/antimonite-responsive transcriptional repressor